MRTLVWFRGKDLRVSDHVPLCVAARRGDVVPLFVVDPYFFEPRRAQCLPHRMQFLLESLEDLRWNLAGLGAPLLLVSGRSVDVVPDIARRVGADRVVAQRWVEPFGRERDRRVADRLEVPFELHEGETLHELGTLRSGAGRGYEVFTPFERALRRTLRVAAPLPVPHRLVVAPHGIVGEDVPTLATLGIERNPGMIGGGEGAARMRLAAFLRAGIAPYDRARDRLGEEGTSRLSADLKFGTISPRTVYREALEVLGSGAERFVTELLWREFTHGTLHDHPDLLEQSFRSEYDRTPWQTNDAHFSAWAEGRTGVPVVDAAARQLIREGFVHNRARMIAASFLVKHLRQHYRRGEQHYLKYLVDGDWAQNNFGWQWSAGCGVGAQPYFRVMNPVSQAEKFDAEGGYVRRYVPELGRLPVEFIHRPWSAPSAVLRQAGVRLGVDYPLPIVDLAGARAEYLQLARSVFRRSNGLDGRDDLDFGAD
jgi:deoxyribodipyrimidine photo-lyase